MIFREKIINPDFHTGNLLVNPVTKVIYPIDWGQAEKIVGTRADTLYHSVRLLNALSAGGSRLISEILSIAPHLLREGVVMSSSKFEKLKELLKRSLRPGESSRELMQKTVSAFSDAGLPLNDFLTLKIMKGLLILQGENYVNAKEFEDLFKAEARRYILHERLWNYASDSARSWLGLSSTIETPVRQCERLLK